MISCSAVAADGKTPSTFTADVALDPVFRGLAAF